MEQKHIKNFYLIFFILFFICVIFLPNKIFGANLEISHYPQVGGATVDSNTKLPEYVFYLFNVGMFIGFFSVFLSFIIAGVTYLLSPIDPKAQLLASAKDRVSGAISGLLVLALTYLILTTIYPGLSILKLDQLEPVSQQPPEEKKPAGVYLYKETGCPKSEDAPPNISSISDFGLLKNKVNSVGIIKDPESQAYYVAVLYDTINFRGKCQYLDPNQKCQSVEPFAASASIYQYDFSPNGDGVYFYRKSFFNEDGGYYKVKNSEISGYYEARLEDLKFEGVPKEEQDCIKYELDGECKERIIPSLGGENISSIKIKGNYFVLLFYAGPGKDCSDFVFDFCQAFPTQDDVNKTGPQQIKWQAVRNNSSGVIPNCVAIVPVKQK